MFQSSKLGKSGFGINTVLFSGDAKQIACRISFMVITNDDLLTFENDTLKDKEEV